MAGDAGEIWTVLKLLNWTKEYLARTGIDQPRLAAEVLLAHVLGCRRIELYVRYAYRPSDDERARFRASVQRAAQHEPVAYLVGEKEFYSLPLTVTPDVLVPRPETELLVEQAVAHLRALGRAGRMWDVCTGSGCVAVATASQVPEVSVLATDVSEPAVAVAAGNAERHGLADRIRCRRADLLALPDDCAELAPFDVIAANPPYVADGELVAEEVRHEPPVALHAGPDGLDCIGPLIAGAPDRLAGGGALLLEFGRGQADAVRDLLAATGAFAEPQILRDLQAIERAAVAVRQ